MDETTRECLLLLWTMQRYVASLEVPGESFDELDEIVKDRRGEIALAVDKAFFLLMTDEPGRALEQIRVLLAPEDRAPAVS